MIDPSALISMLNFRKCPFYRDSESLSRGKGLGNCDLGGEAICEGDTQFCERSDDLRKQLTEKEKDDNKGEGSQKEKAVGLNELLGAGVRHLLS
jgi:hypothetical protein